MLTSSGDCENAIGWIKLLSRWRPIARRRFGFQSFARASMPLNFETCLTKYQVINVR